MYGVMSVRKALVLWQRCYVQLDEVDGVLSIAPSPTSHDVKLVPLDGVELLQPAPLRLTLVCPQHGGRSVHLRTDTAEQHREWVRAILTAQGVSPAYGVNFTASGLERKHARTSPRCVRFCLTSISGTPTAQALPTEAAATASADSQGASSWAKGSPQPLRVVGVPLVRKTHARAVPVRLVAMDFPARGA
eukprot:RCo051847